MSWKSGPFFPVWTPYCDGELLGSKDQAVQFKTVCHCSDITVKQNMII